DTFGDRPPRRLGDLRQIPRLAFGRTATSRRWLLLLRGLMPVVGIRLGRRLGSRFGRRPRSTPGGRWQLLAPLGPSLEKLHQFDASPAMLQFGQRPLLDLANPLASDREGRGN